MTELNQYRVQLTRRLDARQFTRIVEAYTPFQAGCQFNTITFEVKVYAYPKVQAELLVKGC